MHSVKNQIMESLFNHPQNEGAAGAGSAESSGGSPGKGSKTAAFNTKLKLLQERRKIMRQSGNMVLNRSAHLLR